MADQKYKGIRIFDALLSIEKIKATLRDAHPSFTFVAEKGDIAEAYAAEAYDLTLAPKGQRGYDAIGKNGERVSIKMLWEINKYRGLHLSGGSNRKDYAYRDAEYLLAVGRDETTGQMSTLYNGPIEFLEEYIKGGPVHPRIEVRTLKKVFSTVPFDRRLRAISEVLPDANPVFYPKDLHLFGIPRDYWQKFTMLWRNYKNRHLVGVGLQDFLDLKSGVVEGTKVLSLRDCRFLELCYKYYEREYDHFTSAFAAYAELHGIDFPDLTKVSAANYRKYGFSNSALQAYRKHEFIRQHFSYFFTYEHRGEGGRVLTRYMTPHDIRLLTRAYEIRGRERDCGRGVRDQVDYIVAGIQAAKEIGEAPRFTMPDPRDRI